MCSAYQIVENDSVHKNLPRQASFIDLELFPPWMFFYSDVDLGRVGVPKYTFNILVIHVQYNKGIVSSIAIYFLFDHSNDLGQ